MIRSMTGYGEAHATHDGVHYHLELRSLNNKFFKCATRLPEELAALDAEIEARLRKSVHRGSFALIIHMRVIEAAAASHINDDILLAYLDHLETIRGRLGEQNVNIDLTQLLALPGVLQPAFADDAMLDRARPVLMGLVDQAAEKLCAMRVTEGEALVDDLTRQLDLIRHRLATIRERAPLVVEEYHHRLRARVDELIKKAQLTVEQPELIREVAIFADRADVSEEVTRITGHIEQFRQVLAADDNEPAGRTLDFIAQELLREANTIASKSNDSAISRAVVDIKSAVDRLKEQVQNVE